MNTKGILSRLSRTAACIALAAGAQQALAQDIKIGFNGDLSASPSAQSGQAAVLGLKTAIEDINRRRRPAGPQGGASGARRPVVAAKVDPEHDGPDRQ